MAFIREQAAKDPSWLKNKYIELRSALATKAGTAEANLDAKKPRMSAADMKT